MTRPAPAPWKVPVSPSRTGLVLGLLVVALAWGAPAPARAQSKSDAFAGKIPPVSAQLYQKAGRFETTLSGNLSVTDPFYSKYFLGAKVGTTSRSRSRPAP